jgi:hypothetical protein
VREPLYTIFLEYKGGTYISQLRAPQLSVVLELWANQISDIDLAEWGLNRSSLIAAISRGDLVPVTERVNVWCLSGTDGGDELILLNVVKMSDD